MIKSCRKRLPQCINYSAYRYPSKPNPVCYHLSVLASFVNCVTMFFFFPLLNYRVGSSNNFQKYIKKNYENYMIFEKEFLLILTSILLI